MDDNTSADVTGEFPNNPLETKRIQRNRRLQFNLSLTGEEIYRHLNILEDVAVRSAAHAGSYLEIRECVLLAERFRAEARKQGF